MANAPADGSFEFNDSFYGILARSTVPIQELERRLREPNIPMIINTPNENGYKPIQIVNIAQPEAINLLLTAGADPNVLDTCPHPHTGAPLNRSPIMDAASEGYGNSVEVFLRHPGIVCNNQDRWGNTVAHYICQERLINALKVLLDPDGARVTLGDLQIRNENNQRPIDIAVSKGFGDIEQLLLEAEARFIAEG